MPMFNPKDNDTGRYLTQEGRTPRDAATTYAQRQWNRDKSLTTFDISTKDGNESERFIIRGTIAIVWNCVQVVAEL